MSGAGFVLALSFQDGVDCRRRFAVVPLEQVGVTPQSDIGLGMAKPPADRDHIDALVDQLTGVGVPQTSLLASDLLGIIAPSRADRIRGKRRTVNVCE